MVTAKPKGTYTIADYFATPEGERWELIDGVLYQMAAAPNSQTSGRVGEYWPLLRRPHPSHAAWDWCTARRLPSCYPANLPLSRTCFSSAWRVNASWPSGGCEGPPDLVVEILSPANRRHDLEIKRELYARHGIPEYWILDSDAETVWALTEPITDISGGVYTVETLYYPGDVLTTTVMPGLAIPVAEIFANPW